MIHPPAISMPERTAEHARRLVGVCFSLSSRSDSVKDGAMAPTPSERRDRFRVLHQSGVFVLPNPYDTGTARLLAAQGFQALATTSAGFAATLGRLDMQITREELIEHTKAMAAATHLPLNVDAERCYADDVAGVHHTVQLLADAGAAGFSIEDWNPATNQIDPLDTAAARVAAAAETAHRSGLLLTARCENHLHGIADVDDTIARLQAYKDAGADVLYAPLLPDIAAIKSVVALGLPVNVLLLPGGPTVAELGAIGVRRISTGSLLANAALGAFVDASQSLLNIGQLPAAVSLLPHKLAAKAFLRWSDSSDL
jgi:2-methylisocitrate lyase-like PEP mutase family enzyme